MELFSQLENRGVPVVSCDRIWCWKEEKKRERNGVQGGAFYVFFPLRVVYLLFCPVTIPS